MKTINIELFLEEEQDLNINIVVRKGKVECNTLPPTESINKLPVSEKVAEESIVDEKPKATKRTSKKAKEESIPEKPKNPGNYMDIKF